MQNYRLTKMLSLFLCIFMMFGLTACDQDRVLEHAEINRLEKENISLEAELESLKALLETEPGTTATKKVEVKPGQTTVPTDSYLDHLKVDGRLVKDMTEEELKAHPTIIAEITDPDTGEVTLSTPPETITNLYDQLIYLKNMQDKVAVYEPGQTTDHYTFSIGGEQPLNPTDTFDVSDQSLYVSYREDDSAIDAYAISAANNRALTSLLADLEPGEKIDLPSDYTDYIYASTGHVLCFREVDLRQAAPRESVDIVDPEGLVCRWQPAGDGDKIRDLRDILTTAQQQPLFSAEGIEMGIPKNRQYLQVRPVGNPTPDVLPLSLRNATDTSWIYGDSYLLSRYDGQEWRALEAKGIPDQGVIKTILPGEERDFDLPLADMYGELPAGFYLLRLNIVPEGKTQGVSYQRSYLRFFALYDQK